MKRRKTASKEKILGAFKENHTLESKDLIEKFPEINPATIFRNLNRFVEDKIIKEIHIKPGVTTYELVTDDDHQHFLCSSCGRISAIYVADYQLKSAVPRDLSISKIEMNVYGICDRCY